MTAPTLADLLVRTRGDASGCLLWGGAVDGFGYGRVGWREDGATHFDRVHRLVDIYLRGPLADGECVLHTCDTPTCVHPAHLFRGDRAANNADKVAKGRQASGGCRMPGESNPNAKVTDAQVEQIRQLAASGKAQRAIGARFGISQSQVGRIVSGTRRAAPTGPRQPLRKTEVGR